MVSTQSTYESDQDFKTNILFLILVLVAQSLIEMDASKGNEGSFFQQGWTLLLLALGVFYMLKWPSKLRKQSITSERAQFVFHSSPNSQSTSTTRSLHEEVLGAFYNLKKGAVIVSSSDEYMIAIEFDGPLGSGGVYGEMAFVDKTASVQALVRRRRCKATDLGKSFLAGETIHYIQTDPKQFFDLLKRYKRGATTQGLIDLKSGLKLYNVRISR